MIYVLDANTLVWHVSGSPRLSRRVRLILDNLGPNDRLVVPAIAIAEAWDVARKQRGGFAPFQEVMQFVRTGNTTVMDLNLELLAQMDDPALDVLRQWPRLWVDIHDMIVVAAALLLRDVRDDAVSIISSDGEMREQPVIPCLW